MIEFLKQIDLTIPEQNFNLVILAMLVVMMVVFQHHDPQKHGHQKKHSSETN